MSATSMEAMEVSCSVNGAPVSRVIDVRTTLAHFLREDLGLTGTKISCDMQVCGVCTVLVDEEPVSSCTYLAVDVHGTSVMTIEGLARNGALHPLQTAFVDHMALQCGFCTPGFLMMSVALLAQNPEPTRDEIIEYLDGNLCRCTGYAPIVAAVSDAAAILRDAGGDGVG